VAWRGVNKSVQEAPSKTQEWIDEHARGCPVCGVAIQKNGGCDHMNCANCGENYTIRSVFCSTPQLGLNLNDDAERIIILPRHSQDQGRKTARRVAKKQGQSSAGPTDGMDGASCTVAQT
jgi:predicted RNA-binding Zn-ribbon protein involved in translation (DUF1610 family)